MVTVKICGITNLEDARLAVEAGADALGFNFYKKSPRHIEPVAARKIIDHIGGSVMHVGVFVDHSIGEVLRTIDAAGIDAVQLHGEESAAFVSDLGKRCDRDIIKAFRVAPGFDHKATLEFDVRGVLLDGYSRNARGGTGETFDWGIANLVRGIVPELWLAGGLTPDNVRNAVDKVDPFAVDVCSSIESSPGIKDRASLRRFILEAKSHD